MTPSIRRTLPLFGILLLLLITGCSITLSLDPNGNLGFTVNLLGGGNGGGGVVAPAPTLAPAATQATTGGGGVATAVPACTPNTTWPTYVVANNDTLARIAARAGVSLQELVTANCITNPDIVIAGQTLRVPVDINATATVTPTGFAASETPVGTAGAPTNTAVAVQASGGVTVTPNNGMNNNIWVLNQGVDVTLAWPETPGGFARVEFYLTPTGGAATLIGTDTDNTNGASITWNVPAALTGVITATAFNETGAFGQTANPLPVVSV
jgi:LysM repeat protein